MEIVNNRYKIVRETNYIEDDFTSFVALDFHNDSKPVTLSLIDEEKCSNFAKDFIKDNFIKISSTPNNFIFHNYDFASTMLEINASFQKVFYFTYEFDESYRPISDYLDSLKIEDILLIVLQICQCQNLAILNGYLHPIRSLHNFFISFSEFGAFQVKAQNLVSISLCEKNFDQTYQFDCIADLFLSLFAGYSKTKSFFDNVKYIREEYKDPFLSDYQNNIIDCILDVCEGIRSGKYGENVYDFYYLLIADINDTLKSFFELDDSDSSSYVCNLPQIESQQQHVFRILDIIRSGDKSDKHNVFLLTGNLGSGKRRFLKDVHFLLNFENADSYFFEAINDSNTFFVQLLSAIMDNYPKLKHEIDLNALYLQIKDFNLEKTYLLESKYSLISKINAIIKKAERIRPQVIIVDNFNKVDKFTLEFIFSNIEQDLADSNVYFLLSFTKNFTNTPRYFKAAYESMVQNKTCLEIQVKALSQFETAVLIKEALFMRTEPVITAKEINKITGGNPYFTLALIKSLVAKGELWRKKDTGQWQMQNNIYNVSHFFEVPSSIQVLAENSFKEYFKDDNKVYRRLAIFHVYLKKIFLYELFPELQSERIEAIFKGLIANNFISKIKKDIYRVDEKILQGSLYGLLEENDRRTLHQKALKIIEKEDDEIFFDELLIHYDYLGFEDKVLSLLLEKADSDRDEGDLHSAIINYERALLFLEKHSIDEKLAVTVKLSSVYYNLGKINPAMQNLMDFEDYVDIVKDKKVLLHYFIIFCNILYEAYEIDKFKKQRENLENLLKEISDLSDYESLSIKRIDALNDIVHGDRSLAENKLNKLASSIIESGNNEKMLADIYRFLGNIKAFQDKYKEANDFYDKSYENAKKYNEVKKMLGALNNAAGALFFYENNFKDAEKTYKEVLDLASKTGFEQIQVLALINLALLYIETENNALAEYYMNLVNERLIVINLHSKDLILRSKILNYSLLIKKCQYIKALTAKSIFEASLKKAPEDPLLKAIVPNFYEYSANLHFVLGNYKEAIHNLELAHKAVFNERSAQVISFKIQLIKAFTDTKVSDGKLKREFLKVLKSSAQDDLRNILLFSINYIFISIACNKFHLFKSFAQTVIEKSNTVFDDSVLINIRIKIIKALLAEELNESFLIALIKDIKGQDALFIEILIKTQLALNYYNNRKYAQGLLVFLDVQSLILKFMQQVPNDDKVAFFNIYAFKAPFKITYNFIKLGASKINKSIFLEKVSDIGLKRLSSSNDLAVLSRNADFHQILLGEIFFANDWILRYRNLNETLQNFTTDYENNIHLIINLMMQKLFANYANIIISDQNEKKQFMFNAGDDETWLLAYSQALKKNGINGIRKILNDLNYELLVLPIPSEQDDKTYTLAFLIKKHIMIISQRRVSYCKKLLPFLYSLLKSYELNNFLIKDSSSGASNIPHFEKVLKSYVNYSNTKNSNISVCYFSIPNLKSINKFLKNEDDGKILRPLLDLIYNNLESKDVLARYTTDEFAILFYNTNKNFAKHKFELIIDKVAQSSFNEIALPVTFTAGIATIGEDGTNIENIVDKAHIAMLYAKSLGTNKVAIYHPSFESSASTLTSNEQLHAKNINYNFEALNIFFDLFYITSSYISKTVMLSEFLKKLFDYMNIESISLILFNEEVKGADDRAEKIINVANTDNCAINKIFVQRATESMQGFFTEEVQIHRIDSLNFPTWHSVLLCPINQAESVKGVFYITAKAGQGSFTGNDLAFINLVSLLLEKEI